MTSVRWIGIAFTLAATASRAAADPPCKPSAQLKGEHAVVIAIEPMLRARGIDGVVAASTDPAFVASSCRSVTAEVATLGARIMVWVTDADGRRAQRLTEDTEAAATIIESWARGDLVDPLLDARATLEVGPFDTASSSTTTSVGTIRSRPRYLVTGGGDVGVSGDGALWAGARAQGCGMIGAFCVGGALRYAIDLERSGDTAELGTGRTALALMATGERLMRRGPFVMSLGVGVGLASVTATRDQENELEQASALSARIATAGALELADAWSIRADLVAELAPFARARLGEADGIDRQLAASPKLQTWFGISLAYGGP
ncbi:MAG: hypothetical protein ACKV2T_26245 [Kofleriaceae bacterium]